MLWIFDLWPNSMSVIPISNSYVANFASKHLESFIKIIYSGFGHIFVSSPSFLSSKCLKRAKASVLYSWEKEEKEPFPSIASNLVNKDEFIKIISIGNLGNAHDLELIEKLLLHTSNKNFRWSFVGSGSGMTKLEILFYAIDPKRSVLWFKSKNSV